MNRLWLIAVACLLQGCATGTYSAPKTAPNSSSTQTIQMPFDAAWSKLVEHVSESFFVIDNVSKESGLLTLSYGADRPSRFIDCGIMDRTAGAGGPAWNGSYADYLAVRQGASLGGKMNILMQPIDAASTKIRVTAKYVFQAPATRNGPGTTWAFDSGGSDVQAVSNPLFGTEPARTCQPTGGAEAEILKAFSE